MATFDQLKQSYESQPKSVLGPNGRPWQDQYGYQEGVALPHVIQFTQVLQTAWKTYIRNGHDEALRHDPSHAKSMRNDPFLMGILQERALGTSSLRWHLEVDDEKDWQQVAAKDTLTTIIKATSHQQKLIEYLTEDTLWFGRSGSQLTTKPRLLRLPDPDRPQKKLSREVPVITYHEPVHGDNFVFEWDGTPSVLINTARSREIPLAAMVTTDWGKAISLRGTWRTQFIVHKHKPMAADFFDGEQAGAIHGVGIRSFIYWLDWLRKELIGFILDLGERMGRGVRIWYYESGNPESERQVLNAAQTQTDRTNILVPRTKNAQGKAAEGLDLVDSSTAAQTLLLDILKHWEEQIERYMIGQTGSSRSDTSGMGTHSTDMMAETKQHIIAYDANNLADTMTEDLIRPLLLRVLPKLADIPVRWVFEIDQPNPELLMGAVQTAFGMGVKFEANSVRSITGMPAPKDGDEVISAAEMAKLQQQQAPQAPGGQVPGAAPGESTDVAGDETPTDQDLDEVMKHLGVGDEKPQQMSRRERPVRYARIKTRDLQRASKDIEEPTPAQRESGNYRKGHITWKGLGITIETPKGATRSGTNRSGKSWSVTMQDYYGYIKRTLSEADGDHIDVFIAGGDGEGEDLDSDVVFVVNQHKVDGRFDEHKCMLGYTSAKSAKSAYLSNYSAGWTGFGSMTAITVDAFKEWLETGKTKKPLETPNIYSRREQLRRYAEGSPDQPAPTPKPAKDPAPSKPVGSQIDAAPPTFKGSNIKPKIAGSTLLPKILNKDNPLNVRARGQAVDKLQAAQSQPRTPDLKTPSPLKPSVKQRATKLKLKFGDDAKAKIDKAIGHFEKFAHESPAAMKMWRGAHVLKAALDHAETGKYDPKHLAEVKSKMQGMTVDPDMGAVPKAGSVPKPAKLKGPASHILPPKKKLAPLEEPDVQFHDPKAAAHQIADAIEKRPQPFGASKEEDTELANDIRSGKMPANEIFRRGYGFTKEDFPELRDVFKGDESGKPVEPESEAPDWLHNGLFDEGGGTAQEDGKRPRELWEEDPEAWRGGESARPAAASPASEEGDDEEEDPSGSRIDPKKFDPFAEATAAEAGTHFAPTNEKPAVAFTVNDDFAGELLAKDIEHHPPLDLPPKVSQQIAAELKSGETSPAKLFDDTYAMQRWGRTFGPANFPDLAKMFKGEKADEGGFDFDLGDEDGGASPALQSPKRRGKALYRASEHDKVRPGFSFSEHPDDAREYQNNPGFGGSKLFKTEVQLGRVLNLTDERRQWADLEEALGEEVNPLRHQSHFPRAITNSDEVLGKIRDKGYQWVKFTDDFPKGSTTYVPVTDEAAAEAEEYLKEHRDDEEGGESPALTKPTQPRGGDVRPMAGEQPAVGPHTPSTPAATAPFVPATEHHAAIDAKINATLDASAHKLSPGQREAYQGYARSVISKLPPKAAEHVAGNLKDVQFHKSVADLDKEVRLKYPTMDAQLNKRGYKGHVGGLYDQNTGQMFLDGPTMFSDGEEGGDLVYAHEFGHAIDGENFQFSNTPDWGDAWKTELANSWLGKAGPIGDYAGGSRREGWAEFCRLVYGQGVNPDELRKRFPRSTAFFEKSGLLPGSKQPYEKPIPIFDKAIEDPATKTHADTLLPEDRQVALALEDHVGFVKPEQVHRDEGDISIKVPTAAGDYEMHAKNMFAGHYNVSFTDPAGSYGQTGKAGRAALAAMGSMGSALQTLIRDEVPKEISYVAMKPSQWKATPRFNPEETLKKATAILEADLDQSDFDVTENLKARIKTAFESGNPEAFKNALEKTFSRREFEQLYDLKRERDETRARIYERFSKWIGSRTGYEVQVSDTPQSRSFDLVRKEDPKVAENVEHLLSKYGRDASNKFRAKFEPWLQANAEDPKQIEKVIRGKETLQRLNKGEGRRDLPSPALDLPKKSKAPMTVTASQTKEVEDFVKKQIPGADVDEVPSLFGVPDDATRTMVHMDGSNEMGVYVDHPDAGYTAPDGTDVDDSIEMSLKKAKYGDPYMYIDWIGFKKSAQGKGLATNIVGSMIENAQKAGIKSIRCHAARDNPRNRKEPLGGYYVWPRMGFDADILSVENAVGASKAKEIKQRWPDAKSLLDIMDTTEGNRWWLKNGADITDARFDTTPGSRSMQVWEKYQAEKRAKR